MLLPLNLIRLREINSPEKTLRPSKVETAT
jgi:hypothetical protein